MQDQFRKNLTLIKGLQMKLNKILNFRRNNCRTKCSWKKKIKTVMIKVKKSSKMRMQTQIVIIKAKDRSK